MGQSSSRQSPPSADQRSPQRRRRRTRPASTVFSASTSNNQSQHNASATPSLPRRRSVHIPNLSSHPWPERQQTRSRSPSRLSRFASLRQARSHNRSTGTQAPSIGDNSASAPRSGFPRRVFSRLRRDADEPRPPRHTPRAVPRDSLEMEQTRRNGNRLSQTAPILPFPDLNPPQPPLTDFLGQPLDRQRPLTSRSNRIASLTPARDFGSRFTASIRRRRHRPNRDEDHNQMLQRLLSVAAAATAATLMGSDPEAAIQDLRRAAAAVDNATDNSTSFYNFLSALRGGQAAANLRRTAEQANNQTPNNAQSNSLDFFRMFRLDPGDNSSPPEVGTIPEEQQTESDGEGRTVSILIVGIRSLNGETETQTDQTDAMPSFIDALANHNTTINLGLQDQPSRPRGGPNLGALNRGRRASMGTFFPSRSFIRPGRASGMNRPLSEVGSSATRSEVPEFLPDGLATAPTEVPEPSSTARTSTIENQSGEGRSDEPIGENNESSASSPRIAPRSRFLENVASRNSWRNSLGSLPSFASRGRTGTGISRDNANTESVRASGSDFEMFDRPDAPQPIARPNSGEHLRFGSGSSRRNGIVEPDHSDAHGNRSWIIYVLGGNYPENHPILTTPSLFTDNPTYEDMLLLSQLLGPARPPVAQQNDVDAAGGLLTIQNTASGKRVARDMQQDEQGDAISTLPLEPGQSCQVCLEEYTVTQVVRRLKTCGHMFHRICVDHVSH